MLNSLTSPPFDRFKGQKTPENSHANAFASPKIFQNKPPNVFASTKKTTHKPREAFVLIYINF